MRDDEERTATATENQHDEQSVISSAPDSIDVAGDESFPASDPPANTPIIRVGCPCHFE